MGSEKHRLDVPRAPAALVAVAALALLLANLGGTDLWAPDEPRYAQVAEELRALPHGARGVVLLHLNGEPYTQKPPLYYWAAALFGALSGGVGEWAARLPSALAGLACLASTFALGRALYGGALARAAATPAAHTVGLWAAALLLTTYRFPHLARRAQLDVLLTAFELAAFLVLARIAAGGATRARIAALHAALGAAVLTKGPVGLLPLVAFAAYLVWEGRAGELRRLAAPWAWLLSLGPGLLWIAGAVVLAPEGFFGEAVVDNLLGRFFAGTAHVRPFYYFAYQLPLDALPWTLLWPLVVWHFRQSGLSSADRFALAWVASYFVFFSLSAGKRGLYLLPCLPALCLLCGAALQQWLAERRTLPRAWGWVAGGLACAIAAAGAWGAASGGLELASAPGFGLPPAVCAALAATGGLALAAGLVSRARLGAPGGAAATLGGLAALELVVLAAAYPAFEPEKSPRLVARAAAAAAPAGAAIGVFDHRAMVGGLAFYAPERTVVEVPDTAAAERFFAAGGGALVVRADKLPRLETLPGLAIDSRLRSGRRQLAVLVPSAEQDQTHPPGR